MSISGILAAATTLPTTQSAAAAGGGEEEVSRTFFVVTVVLSVVMLAVAVWLGVLRPGSIDGPVRIDRRRPVWPLALIWGAGTCVWFGTMTVLQVAVLAVRHPDLFRRAGQQGQGMQASQIEQMLTPEDWAIFAIVPAVVAFFCLLIGDLIWNRGVPSWLGFGWKKAPKGALKGAGATLIILPWIFLVSIGAQWLFEWIGYTHEHEHVLLRVMKTASPWAKIGLIVGATVVAPFFEEYLFRGHLQTLLRQVFIRMSHRRLERFDGPPLGADVPVWAYPPGVSPGAAASAGGPYPGVLYPPPPPYGPPVPAGAHYTAFQPQGPPFPGSPAGMGEAVPYRPAPLPPDLSVPLNEPRRPYVWQTWLAVFLTSIAFMLVHFQPWMFPPIFCLSLCLGYVYERTGNLWANIAIHALFNTTSTVIFLMQQGHG